MTTDHPATLDAHDKGPHDSGQPRPAPYGLAHHFEDLGQQHEAATLGMWAFLATEILFFGAVFLAYSVYRHAYPQPFAAASHHLYLWIGVTNTAVLLTSSFAMVLAVHAAKTGNRRQLVGFLVITILLGMAFLGIKGFEYYKDVQEHLFPGKIFNLHDWEAGFWPVDVKSAAGIEFLRHAELFLVFYYIMTAIHATHMVVGLAIMGILAVKAWRGRYTAEYNDPVDMAGLYWHFVDIVWIFLLPLLYMVRN